MAVFDAEAQGGDFEQVQFIQDKASGLQAILAVHNTRRGPAFGGIRRLPYASEAAALEDARRLAEGMSLKLALAELPAGGAKTVMMHHGGLDVRAAYRGLGRAIDKMGGGYICGPDVGTGATNLECVRESTPHVNPQGNDANRSTAAGVMAGLRGVLGVMQKDVQDASVLVQGLGGVGGALALSLAELGATVYGCDPNPATHAVASSAGIKLIDVDAALTTAVDVYMPCALGGTLTPDIAGTIPVKAICGSANNQLADPAAGANLHQRGILYAPDFAVNVGAVAEGVYTTLEGANDAARAKAYAEIDRVEGRVAEILARSAAEDLPSAAAALRMARANLA